MWGTLDNYYQCITDYKFIILMWHQGDGPR